MNFKVYLKFYEKLKEIILCNQDEDQQLLLLDPCRQDHLQKMRVGVQWWQAVTHLNLCKIEDCQECVRIKEDLIYAKHENNDEAVFLYRDQDLSLVYNEYNEVVDQKRLAMFSKVKMVLKMIEKSIETKRTFEMLKDYVWMLHVDRLFMIHKTLINVDYFQWLITDVRMQYQWNIDTMMRRKDLKFFACLRESVYPLNRLEPTSACDGEIYLTEAVPGAGKTFAIREMLNKTYSGDIRLVIVATNEQKKDYEDVNLKGVEVRTADSFINEAIVDLCRGEKKFSSCYSEIYVDEMFMLHAAQVYYIKYLCQSEAVMRCYGDRGQIPVQSRVQRSYEYQCIPEDLFTKVYTMSKSRRIPQPSVEILKHVYKDITTFNDTNPIYQVCLIQPFDWFDTVGKEKILVFTQSEKEMVLKYTTNVLTVHEAQGMTFDDVIVLRLHYFDVPLYMDVHYLTVALSRNTRTFKYLTVKYDYLAEVIDGVSCLENKEWQQEYFSVIPAPIEGEYHVIDVDCQNVQLEGIKAEFAKRTGFLNSILYMKERIFKMIYSFWDVPFYSGRNYDKDFELMIFEVAMTSIFGRFEPDDDLSDDTRVNLLLDKLSEYKNIKIDRDQFLLYFMKHEVRNDENKVLVPKYNLALRGRIRITPDVLVESLIKRNLDVSHLRDEFSTIDVDEMVHRFKTTYFTDTMIEDIFNPYEQVCQWLDFRNGRQIGKLQATFDDDVIQEQRWSRYECFLKTTVKLKMRERESVQIIPVQVVTGANSMTVMYFNIYVKQMQNRLISRLKEKFIYNDGFDVNALEEKMNAMLVAEKTGYTSMKVVEMDYSKFDKNQDEIMMVYQLMIFQELGISNRVIVDYIISHLNCELIFREAGLRVTVNAQRRTGDAFTFFGNTLMTMMMATYAFKEEDILLGIYGGDDSLIFLKPQAQIKDETKFIASAFNMELKYLDSSGSLMFASRFLVYSNYRLRIYPDVLKIITRMFREDIESIDHFTALTLSMKLLLIPVDPADIFDLVQMTAHRYRLNRSDVSDVYWSFMRLIEHDDLLELYEIKDQEKFYKPMSDMQLTVLKENVFKRFSVRQMYDISSYAHLTEREKRLLIKFAALDERMKKKDNLMTGHVFLYSGVHVLNDAGLGVPIEQLDDGTLIDVQLFSENVQELTKYFEKLKKRENFNDL